VTILAGEFPVDTVHGKAGSCVVEIRHFFEVGCGVAILTLGPELARVSIKVASAALRRHVGERNFLMTIPAVEIQVLAGQWERRFSVRFHPESRGCETGLRMTVTACVADGVAMRIIVTIVARAQATAALGCRLNNREGDACPERMWREAAQTVNARAPVDSIRT